MDRRRFLGLVGRAGVVGIAAQAGLAALPPLARASAAHAQPGAPGPGADAHGPGVLDVWFRTLYSGLMDEPGVTPGRAARIYAYTAVAAYEAVVPGARDLVTLAGQLNGLRPIALPSPSKAIDWPTAASAAIAAAAASLLRDGSTAVLAAIAARRASVDEERAAAGVPTAVLERSRRHGDAVGVAIGTWAREDGAEATYTRPYTPPAGPALWRSTPPNFGTAIDPYWGSVRPMALPSAAACAPPPPPAPFSLDPGSAFAAQVQAVLDASDALTDEGRATALYWRDNPVTSGLPSGHWMLLTSQLALERGLSLATAAEVLAVVGITLDDAFISCWHEKYVTNLLRPVSYIQAHVPGRSDWLSFVNTPQFPEYTSGHSVASQAAAAVLTATMGTFPFTDRSHTLRNPGLGVRSFSSFQDAAEQAAGSRLLGGIHYPMGIEVGLDQGAHVGARVLQQVRTRRRARR